MNRIQLVAATAAITALTYATLAHAQPDWRATPVYGSVSLSAGFTPDPWVRSLEAGGTGEASTAGRGCRGRINLSAPDVDLHYNAGSLSLYFRVESDADTTLVVRDPNGRWHCDDDTVGLDPVVEFRNPRSGMYNVWVGTYSSGGLRPADLLITELQSVAHRTDGGSRGRSGRGGGSAGRGNQPDWTAQPLFTSVNLRAGFTPDPWRHDIQAGGQDDASDMIRGCVGYINAAAPDIDLHYGAGSLPLHIRAASNSDTTLVVRAPDGSWHCDDDTIGLDPVVSFRNPQSGMYNIWVGIYGRGTTAPAQVRISELDPNR